MDKENLEQYSDKELLEFIFSHLDTWNAFNKIEYEEYSIVYDCLNELWERANLIEQMYEGEDQ